MPRKRSKQKRFNSDLVAVTELPKLNNNISSYSGGNDTISLLLVKPAVAWLGQVSRAEEDWSLGRGLGHLRDTGAGPDFDPEQEEETSHRQFRKGEELVQDPPQPPVRQQRDEWRHEERK